MADYFDISQQKKSNKFKVVESSPKNRFIRYDIVLGRGAFKTVYYGFDNQVGREVAWNQINFNDEEQMLSSKKILSEVQILRKLQHKNILQLLCVWVDSDQRRVNFITEYLTSGSLRSYRLNHKGLITADVIKHWAYQILQALVYLHGHAIPVIHRDIKSDNIFYNGNEGILKLGDFGLSTLYTQSKQQQTTLGTPEFMAPELMDSDPVYDERVDIYAFGMVLIELCTQKYPYSEAKSVYVLYKWVTQGKLPPELDLIQDQSLKEIITMCVQRKQCRPSARELLKHSCFKSVTESPLLNQNRQKVNLEAKTSLGSSHSFKALGSVHSEDLFSFAQSPVDKAEPCEISRSFTHGDERTLSMKASSYVAITPIDGQPSQFTCKIFSFLDPKPQISFTFDLNSDTVEQIATELVENLQMDKGEADDIASQLASRIQAIVSKPKMGFSSNRFAEFETQPLVHNDKSDIYLLNPTESSQSLHHSHYSRVTLPETVYSFKTSIDQEPNELPFIVETDTHPALYGEASRLGTVKGSIPQTRLGVRTESVSLPDNNVLENLSSSELKSHDCQPSPALENALSTNQDDQHVEQAADVIRNGAYLGNLAAEDQNVLNMLQNSKQGNYTKNISIQTSGLRTEQKSYAQALEQAPDPVIVSEANNVVGPLHVVAKAQTASNIPVQFPDKNQPKTLPVSQSTPIRTSSIPATLTPFPEKVSRSTIDCEKPSQGSLSAMTSQHLAKQPPMPHPSHHPSFRVSLSAASSSPLFESPSTPDQQIFSNFSLHQAQSEGVAMSDRHVGSIGASPMWSPISQSSRDTRDHHLNTRSTSSACINSANYPSNTQWPDKSSARMASGSVQRSSRGVEPMHGSAGLNTCVGAVQGSIASPHNQSAPCFASFLTGNIGYRYSATSVSSFNGENGGGSVDTAVYSRSSSSAAQGVAETEKVGSQVLQASQSGPVIITGGVPNGAAPSGNRLSRAQSSKVSVDNVGGTGNDATCTSASQEDTNGNAPTTSAQVQQDVKVVQGQQGQAVSDTQQQTSQPGKGQSGDSNDNVDKVSTLQLGYASAIGKCQYGITTGLTSDVKTKAKWV